MVERTFYSGELRTAVLDALAPESDGKERVTELEARRARQNFPLDAELAGRIFDAIQTVENGTVFSEGEVRRIEELANGRDFLSALDNLDFCFGPARLFANDSPYATTAGRYEALLAEVARKTGVTVSIADRLNPFETQCLLHLSEGGYDETLTFAHDTWGVTSLSLARCRNLAFLLENNKAPKARKARRWVRLNREANPGGNDDAVVDFPFSDFRRFRRYLRLLDREEATLATLGSALPDHTPMYNSPVSARITPEHLKFVTENQEAMRRILGGGYTVDVAALNRLVFFCLSIPGFFECLTAYAGAGLVMDMDVFIGSSFVWGGFARGDVMDDIPWSELATPEALTRTRALAATLPEGRFVIKTREALETYAELIKTNEGWALIESLMDPALGPRDLENRLNGFLTLARHRQPAEAGRLAPLWPPLGAIDRDNERIETFFLTDTEKYVRLGKILREHYPYLVGNGAFRLGDHAALLEHLDVLADPDFAEYFGSFARRFRFSASEAEYLLLDSTVMTAAGMMLQFPPFLTLPYPKTPEEKASAETALARSADVFQPGGDGMSELKALFLVLQKLPEEETGFYDAFFSAGLIRTATQGADFALGIGTLLTSPYVKALLKDGTLEARWKEIESAFPIAERDSPFAILQALAGWPTDRPFGDIHKIAENLKDLGGEETVSLEETVYFALSPANEAVLGKEDFAVWLKDVELFTEGQVPLAGRTVTGASGLAALTHIYLLGEKARATLTKDGFAKDWALLGRLVIGPFGSPYDPFIALLLLQYPMDGGWEGFGEFVTTVAEMPDVFATEPAPSRKAQEVYKEVYGAEMPRTVYAYNVMGLYKIYWLINESPSARKIWEACLADPNYGRGIVYKDAPVLRTEEKPSYSERPEWSKLNPLFRFMTIVAKMGLGEGTAQDLIAQEIMMDASDKTSEHGGAVFAGMKKGKSARLSRREGNLDFTLDPVAVPSLSVFDMRFKSLDPCWSLGLLDFHLHAVTEDETPLAGPSETPDVAGNLMGREIGLVVTATGGPTEENPTQGFNADIYGYAGTRPGSFAGEAAVVDLGNTRAGLGGGEMIVTPEPFGHGEDLGRFFEGE